VSDFTATSVKELLGLALRAEIDANKTYSDLANRFSNPLLKEKFQMLAYEENKHRQTLEKLHQSLYKGEDIQIPEITDEKLLPSIQISPSTGLVDILYQAMESEKSAQDFYANLASRVKDPQKKILLYLSKVENSHYLMLKSEYSLAQDFEDYAEKDIDKVIT
jgi:rubrerythrin